MNSSAVRAAVQLRRWRRPVPLAFLLVVAAALFQTAARALPAPEENWPQWRGPLGSGVAPTAEPPVEWEETSGIRWKVQIPGQGSATPIIWDDLVFIQTAIPTGKKMAAAPGVPDSTTVLVSNQPPNRQRRPGGFGRNRAVVPTEPYQFVLLAIDRQTGATRWQRVACEEIPHEGHHPDHGFSSHSPVTDGSHVYAYFGSRGLYCYDMEGNLKWEKDFGQMQTKMSFGEGSSPALFGETIVVTWDHEGEDFIVALDKKTGEELWRQSRDEDTTWATPLVVEHEGETQVVTAATNKIRSYDLKSGQVIWEGGGLTPNAIPSPVAGDGMVFVTSGFRGNALFAIDLDARGTIGEGNGIVWTHSRGTPYVPSPLLYGDRLYLFSGNNGILTCFDAQSGEVAFGPERISELEGVYASPVGAAGRVYLVGRNGTTVVIRHADQLEVLAVNQLDGRFDASPALAGNDLFLRSHEHLYSIEGK